LIGMLAGMAGRRSDAEARDTRATILRRAADIGSVEGLEGITIGRLATELGMSKAGVIGHFGSKEELQLATLALAAEMFRERVWVPAENEPAGLPRLLAICDAWTRYAKNPPFTGGCFIAAVSYEFDGRSGRVHDSLAKITKRWRRTLESEVETAIRAGELPSETNPRQIAFSLEALAHGAQPARQLQGNKAAAAWSLTAMHALLGVPAASPRAAAARG
jgi:AcrR family transcriptional regulator